MAAWFNNLPAVLRHLIIIAGSSYLGGLVSAILAAKGVTGVDWPTTLVSDLNSSAVDTVTGLSVLWLLPLNSKYGIGKDTTNA